MLVAGAAAAVYYTQTGLALSHYDARAHLVVSRRILDSLTPGWQQIGAVWLPLPHVINMLPVQIDSWYRTGASGIAISILSMAVAVGALASLIVRTTGSRSGAFAGAALLMGNPNILYLQSTPMTEPLLFATALLSIALTASWLDRGGREPPRAAGWALAMACLTRYEAWPIAAAAIALTVAVLLRRAEPPAAAARAALHLAWYPAVALLAFIANSRWTTGAWFISSGFFVAENKALGQPLLAWEQVREGVYQLSGTMLVWSAYAGATLIAVAFARARQLASLVLLLALAAAAALPWYAYAQGHPLRIRYALPLVAACAAIAAGGIATLSPRIRSLAAALTIGGVLLQSPPLDHSSPLISESLRDARNKEERQAVTRYLKHHYDGRTIMMSMGSLAHYMHDLSHAGFRIHDFLHEGNGELWPYAASGPHGHVGWVAIEERAEGGDVLFAASQRDRHFLDGFERVAEGGGVALYRALTSDSRPLGSPFQGPAFPK
ncbi:MAG: hypothetical protein LC753_02030 [Acidobacteria bacterium]|nr:hypothetical protein [Acidobacteriota bacterium]MCA1649083.1 hypothetical protein [Acidobacteriota bacterium]